MCAFNIRSIKLRNYSCKGSLNKLNRFVKQYDNKSITNNVIINDTLKVTKIVTIKDIKFVTKKVTNNITIVKLLY
ncbi:hypothetical protein [Clostridium taeniosporum]|uniref:Uncharacterized protein n=1 Tax=Clostridium taeniosporum TaxID=394958 RepID=A0A1D7XPD1_9CLOT|nr:hypothetical protein [Clostridium taeniosporum]AOR25182.1 hypothetical protein BGI42_15715 [Clostridium taeniosporum]